MNKSKSNISSTISSLERLSNIVFLVSGVFILFAFVSLFYISERKSFKIVELEKKLAQCQLSGTSIDSSTFLLRDSAIKNEKYLTKPDSALFLIDTIAKNRILDTTSIPVKMIGQWKVCYNVSNKQNYSCEYPGSLYEFLNNGICRMYKQDSALYLDNGSQTQEWRIFGEGKWTMVKNKLRIELREYTEGASAIKNLELYFVTINNQNKFYSQEGKGKYVRYTVIERAQPNYVVNNVSNSGDRYKKVPDSAMGSTSAPVTTAPNGKPIITNPNGKTIVTNPNGRPIIISSNGKPLTINPDGQPIKIVTPIDTTPKKP